MPSMPRLLPVLALAAALGAPGARAATLETLHSFSGGADGGQTFAALVLTKTGTLLYGTTPSGGSKGHGTLFQLDLAARKLVTLHSFTNGADGGAPYAGLLLDPAGMLYGTTYDGGANGWGTVFELDPASRKLSTLHAFTSLNDGGRPTAPLTIDMAGTLYGTTYTFGANGKGWGTVFRLDPAARKLTTLHAFTNGGDGGRPQAGVSLSSTQTMLYGTADQGGSESHGTVFALAPATAKLTVLHSFTDGGDGSLPVAGVTVGPGSALYGTAEYGGAHGEGTVYSLDPATRKLTVLHAFTNLDDGGAPVAGLVADRSGMLYGTASTGGASRHGTVFKLDPVAKKLTTLHAFTNGGDGGAPEATLAIDAAGALYGTTSAGGAHGQGTVFKLTP